MIESINRRIENMLFIEELKRHGLFEMWHHITDNNPGGLNPYHNNSHMFRMSELALKIYRTVWDRTTMHEHEVITCEMDLLLACLWHDFDHSGGRFKDNVNIDRACNAFSFYWNEHGHVHPHVVAAANNSQHGTEFIVKAQIGRVVRLIRTTEYPFKAEPFGDVAESIRDADLLYTFTDDTGPIVYGLFQELQPIFPEGFSFEQFLEGQVKFHAEVELFTPFGKNMHIVMKDAVIEAQKAHCAHCYPEKE